MLTKLKALLGNFLAGRGGGVSAAPAAAPVEYKGYRIKPAPYRATGHFQTAGTIEKDTAEGLKSHAFIRADTYAAYEDALAFTISKAKQIIDQQGDRIFK
jgi:hypothetical protein